ncbi:MAG TPA: DUF5694 domain-containing protein [Permianibacter sp.]|nr:DUF5694 domain-containing protein [Permianibacter sp.]
MPNAIPPLRRFAGALLAASLLCGHSIAAETAAASTPATQSPAKVLMLGSFHFDNPGLDAVKHEVIDVMKAPSQAYLDALADRLAAFKPTVVLLEYNPDNEAKMNERYRNYLNGSYTLERNEIYQIGFRVAKRAGLKSVSSFDERNTPNDGDLWNYMPQHEPERMKQFEKLIADLSAEFQRDHTTLTLQGLLQKLNTPEEDRRNKDLYLLFNPVGAKAKSFNGADSTASWWRRNFRMYANIQLHAAPGARILIIAGQGHTAILRDFVSIDSTIDEEPIAPYL